MKNLEYLPTNTNQINKKNLVFHLIALIVSRHKPFGYCIKKSQKQKHFYRTGKTNHNEEIAKMI